MQIYSHRIGTALIWLGKGLRIFAKQWAKFLSLFMALTFGFGILAILPDFLLLIVSVLSIPIIQMVLFNASHGTAIRGHFLLSDLPKKLQTPSVWLRLLIAALLNTLVIYFIMQITFPSLPLSTEQLESMSSMQMAQYMAEHMSIFSLFPGFALISLYLLFTAWVFPLLSWESMSLGKAYAYSFKATLSNLLPLVFLCILLFCIMLCLILFPQYVALYFIQDISIFYLLIFIAVNTAVVIIHTCQYASYIGMFFEPEQKEPTQEIP